MRLSPTDRIFASIVDQQSAIDELLRKTEGALSDMRASLRDGDRFLYHFVESVRFAQEEETAQDVVFTVPEGQDFFAQRLAFYPSFRQVSSDTATDGPDEISFRPCVFTSYEGVFNPRVENDAAAIDLYVAMSEAVPFNGQTLSRQLQNRPTPVQLFYSGPTNYRRGGATELGDGTLIDPYYASFEFAAGLDFEQEWFLPGGSSVTLNLAPTFAGVRVDPETPSASATLANEYEVTAVLSGHKRIK